MDPETIKALKLQQEAHNEQLLHMDMVYQEQLRRQQEVMDNLVLAAINTGGDADV